MAAAATLAMMAYGMNEQRKARKAAESRTTTLETPTVSAIPEVEDAGDIAKFKKRRRGRAQTIRAGELEPMDIGKRTLLG